MKKQKQHPFGRCFFRTTKKGGHHNPPFHVGFDAPTASTAIKKHITKKHPYFRRVLFLYKFKLIDLGKDVVVVHLLAGVDAVNAWVGRAVELDVGGNEVGGDGTGRTDVVVLGADEGLEHALVDGSGGDAVDASEEDFAVGTGFTV